MRAGRLLAALERLDGELQSRPSHPIMDTASLHASTIRGGREWSVYPDFCRLQFERRTVAGESAETAHAEVRDVLAKLRQDDPEFAADSRVVFSRPAYETPAGHPLRAALQSAASAHEVTGRETGMSFWTDAAVLGEAGIPSVLFGPGGAGLHSVEEYVRVEDVIACRDVLARLALDSLR
jgi:acetylornithine deacetylase